MKYITAMTLCMVAYIFPWPLFVDGQNLHAIYVFSSLCLVGAFYFIDRAWWAVSIQIIECLCIIYESKVILNWSNESDAFYLYHDQFTTLALMLEIGIIVGSMAGVWHGISKFFRFLDGSLSGLKHHMLHSHNHKEHH